MRSAATLVFVLALLAPLGSPADAALPVEEDAGPAAGLNCVERVRIPFLENVIDAKWSPDGSRLAFVRFVRVPSATNPSGYVEDEVLEILDMWTGKVRSYGSIEYGRPAWSQSGRYLAYWGRKADFLEVMDRSGDVVARLVPSMPEFRWSGDALIYVERSTIRVWTGGRVPGTIAKLIERLVPHYPLDDWSWSGDGSRFTLTRYRPDEPDPERLLGWTETGDVVELDAPGATHTEWAPAGAVLLIRYPTRLEVRDEIALTRAAIPLPRGALHSWGADGRTLLLRTPRASVPSGDAFENARVVWPVAGAAAVLPNLFGTRGFSPNGRYFSGTVRTALHDGRLEVFRCLDLPRSPLAAPDPEAGARLAKIDSGVGRLIRPVSGPVAQFVHIAHTGVDIAAPFASPIVAADAGIVTKTGWKDEGGRYACVQHAGGLETCYFHTSAVLVSVGDRVARGQPIALVGMSGRTTGPHVHWEAKLDGKVIDPLLR